MSYYSLISLMPKTPAIDPDASAFLTAAGITSPTITSAINTLVLSFKSAGVWTKMRAIYPLVGGTATTHKFNLKDPRDLNAAFRLQFLGGVNHTSNGITGNGSNAYATTFLNDNTLNINSKHLSMYIRNALTVGSPMGTITSPGTSNRFYPEFSGLDYSTLGVSQQSRALAGSKLGQVLMSKTTSGQFKYYRPATSAITVSAANGTAINSINFLLASSNGGVPEYSLANLAFATIGDGLTDADESNIRTTIQTFQTSLSRQV
jgi:hypothetical protein